MIIEQNIGLLAKVTQTIMPRLPRQVDCRDLEQAGVFGLHAAVGGFNPHRGIRFATYACLRIRGAILDYLRELDWVPRLERRRATEFRTMSSLSAVGKFEQEHIDSITDETADAGIKDSDNDDAFDHRIRPLPETHRKIMHLYYRVQITMREIGERLNLSESRISQIHDEALRILRAQGES